MEVRSLTIVFIEKFFNWDCWRHPWLASHGYVVIRADLRGSGDSQVSLSCLITNKKSFLISEILFSLGIPI